MLLVFFMSQQFLPMWRSTLPRTAKKFLDRSHRFFGCATSPTPSRSQMLLLSVSAQVHGQTIGPNKTCSHPSLQREWFSSMQWWPPTLDCPSASWHFRDLEESWVLPGFA